MKEQTKFWLLCSAYLCAGLLILFIVLCHEPAQGQTFAPMVVGLDNKTFRIVENLGPQSKGDLVLVETGSVPAGTICDATQLTASQGQLYMRVNRNTVNLTWKDNNRKPTVWAKCICFNDLPPSPQGVQTIKTNPASARF